MNPPEWRLGGGSPDPKERRPDVPWLPPPPETIEWRLIGGTEILVWRPTEWRLRSPESDEFTS